MIPPLPDGGPEESRGRRACNLCLVWSFVFCWVSMLVIAAFTVVVLPLWAGFEFVSVPCDRPLAPTLIFWGVFWACVVNAYVVEAVHGMSVGVRKGWRLGAFVTMVAAAVASNVFVFTSQTCESTSAGQLLWPAMDFGSLYKESREYVVSTDFVVGLMLVFVLYTLVYIRMAPKVDGEPRLQPYSQYERFRHHSPGYYMLVQRLTGEEVAEPLAAGAPGPRYRAVGPGHSLMD